MQDCRACRLRRIRCDRTVPDCNKCTKKGLSCPGYSRQIRWTNSIASRGRFKGLSAPKSEPEPDDTPPLHLKSNGSEQPLVQLRHPSQIDEPPEVMLNQLMHYYSLELAPINVWVHSEKNEYTRLVLRLAHTQPALQFAILGISAAHQSCKLKAESRFSQLARHKAIILITDRLRKFTNVDSSPDQTISTNQQGSPEAILAATLVLCNHSLLESGTSIALFHLRAARVLVKSLLFGGASDGELFTFLNNQVASLDILACTTLFAPDMIRNAVIPKLDHGPVVFGHYLRLIHDITVASVSSHDKSCYDHVFFQELEDRFELSRASTLMAIGQLVDTVNYTHQHDIALLVEAFHCAGLIYACKRLKAFRTVGIEEYNCSKLFRLFGRFRDIGNCLPNLSWPIFVAGISSHGNHDRCLIVSRLCHDLVRTSPFRYYSNIPEFLEELWKTPDGNWITLAQAWESRGGPLLAM